MELDDTERGSPSLLQRSDGSATTASVDVFDPGARPGGPAHSQRPARRQPFDRLGERVASGTPV